MNRDTVKMDRIEYEQLIKDARVPYFIAKVAKAPGGVVSRVCVSLVEFLRCIGEEKLAEELELLLFPLGENHSFELMRELVTSRIGEEESEAIDNTFSRFMETHEQWRENMLDAMTKPSKRQDNDHPQTGHPQVTRGHEINFNTPRSPYKTRGNRKR